MFACSAQLQCLLHVALSQKLGRRRVGGREGGLEAKRTILTIIGAPLPLLGLHAGLQKREKLWAANGLAPR